MYIVRLILGLDEPKSPWILMPRFYAWMIDKVSLFLIVSDRQGWIFVTHFLGR